MPMLNPYESQELSNEFPLILAILFGLGLILLVGSIYLLFIKKKDGEFRKKVPEWAVNGAYPIFFLVLPFVLLVSVMLFLPRSWFGIDPDTNRSRRATEQRKVQPERRFLDPDSIARLGVTDTISADSGQ